MPYMAGNALQGGVQGFGGAGLPGFPGVNQQGRAWGGNAMVPGDPAGLHQPGVMRKGGGRYNNRSGPYDRRGNRHGSRSGRLSPVRGMPNMYGFGGPLSNTAAYIPAGHPAASMVAANSFPDAMVSGNSLQDAAPPREAVQGRSLKSYEDLDAVDGAGEGELNY